ncbi:hypothetical protein B296_00056757 [Ensete ventricosum]|uniref:Uncharacterized protein n=1 Tax=Ensete ventricosum TaxID=4639 RepID=A0A426XJ83_ENSVE|nr:hypothetical protein B296_00056757 [Ensete ventricosum]
MTVGRKGPAVGRGRGRADDGSRGSLFRRPSYEVCRLEPELSTMETAGDSLPVPCLRGAVRAPWLGAPPCSVVRSNRTGDSGVVLGSQLKRGRCEIDGSDEMHMGLTVGY